MGLCSATNKHLVGDQSTGQIGGREIGQRRGGKQNKYVEATKPDSIQAQPDLIQFFSVCFVDNYRLFSTFSPPT